MQVIPEGYTNIGDIMSNYDHIIEDGTEEKLKSGAFYGTYPAWNFYGSIWFENSLFKCMIKRYQVHVETIVAPTLEEIMETASFMYGDE